MRIDTTKTTVADLLALLEGADPAEEVTFGKAASAKGGVCWCGCGGTTKSKFVPGHDAKHHSRAKKVARGTAGETLEEALASLPHDESRADFLKWHDAELRKLADTPAAKAAAAIAAASEPQDEDEETDELDELLEAEL